MLFRKLTALLITLSMVAVPMQSAFAQALSAMHIQQEQRVVQASPMGAHHADAHHDRLAQPSKSALPEALTPQIGMSQHPANHNHDSCDTLCFAAFVMSCGSINIPFRSIYNATLSHPFNGIDLAAEIKPPRNLLN
ncbi:MAG TPA: hypothetical protein VJM76_03095 [Gammaproteobacteria bacterium]|nr:hypothetical protein [Gammaproteobacteria bacterium]